MSLASSYKSFYALEKRVLAALESSETSFGCINVLSKTYQSTCRELILQDTALAFERHAETRLWNAHSKVISRFHTTLHRMQSGQSAKGRDVARRKAESQYKKFLRSTSEFYQCLIRELTSGFENAEHVLYEARSSSSAQDPRAVLYTTLCNTSTLRLGDLSRYRKTHLPGNSNNRPDPCETLREARSLYALSSALNPTSGTAHNSLATIARLSHKPVEILLHLHLALLAETPEPMATGNLKVYYAKLLDMHSRGEILPADAHYAPDLSVNGISTGFALLMGMIHAGPPAEDWKRGLILDQLKVVFTRLLGLHLGETEVSEVERLLERCKEVCKSADILREKESKMLDVSSGKTFIKGNKLKEVEQVLQNLGKG